MALATYLDRQRGQFPPPALSLLRADTRRIVIVGARGWVGRTVLALLHAALPADEFAQCVVCFGSTATQIVFDGGNRIQQRALDELGKMTAKPAVPFHLAFLTKDIVAGMVPAACCAANQVLSQTVFDALDPVGVDRLFIASSGAAAPAANRSNWANLRRPSRSLSAARFCIGRSPRLLIIVMSAMQQRGRHCSVGGIAG